MLWSKKGSVYVPNGEQPWACSHAFIPTCTMPSEDVIRVYAAFLDEDQVGRVGYVDVSSQDPTQVLKISDRPVLDIGAAGHFDDSGVSPVSIVPYGDELRLYYVGWQRGVQIRYTLFMGLAISRDGGETFQRHSRVPILDRGDGESFVRTAAHVRYEGGLWRMWYIAGDQWVDVCGKQVPSYNMRYLESDDGIHWPKQGEVCMELEGRDEYGFGRPWILKENGVYRMWYSVRTRSRGYHLGYAESADGRQWTRLDQDAGISISKQGWDSEMICFGCVQQTRHGTYLFYNGNHYGATGFGVAVLNDTNAKAPAQTAA